eukprot:Nk52_evm18s1869 gene=Nk52_evmTU18s1869
MDANGLLTLADMLSGCEVGDEDSTSGGLDNSSPAVMGPGGIGAKKKAAKKALEQPKKKDPKQIWDVEDVPDDVNLDDIDDPREQPEYDIIYKQDVSSEDIYLGMSGNHPGTSSCNEYRIEISLPGSKGSEIELDLKETYLDCRTPKYRIMSIGETWKDRQAKGISGPVC